MANLYNRMPWVTIGMMICLLCWHFDDALAMTATRRKRDNEAILYGNQQGSPHLSVKKSGLESVESKMLSQQDHDSDLESDTDDDQIKYRFETKRKLLKRAKRTLINRSMENRMGPERMLKRRKRDVDEIDPAVMEKLRSLLSRNSDSYYSDDDQMTEAPQNYDDFIPYPAEEPIGEVPLPVEREIPPEVLEPISTPSQNPYELVEVEGTPGLFFPLSDVIEEKENQARNKRDDMDETLYQSKLERLAQMLANEK